MTSPYKNHTILIRTRNRQQWIINYLKLLQHFNYEGTLLIIDDSNKKIHQEISRSIRQYDFRVVLKRGPKSDNLNRIERIYASTIYGVNLIDTDYVSFAADDDFIFPDFIKLGIVFLNSNKDYGTFIGPEIKVTTDLNLKIIKKEIKTWHGCELESPLSRLIDYFNRPTLAYIGVCRTTNFINDSSKYGLRAYPRNKPGYFRSLEEEIPWVSLCYIAGKIKYMPNVLNGVRVFHPSPDRLEQIVLTDSDYSFGPLGDFLNFDSRILINNFTFPLAQSIISTDKTSNISNVTNKINKELLHLLSRQHMRRTNTNSQQNKPNVLKNIIFKLHKLLFMLKHYQESSHLFSKKIAKYTDMFYKSQNMI